MLWRGRNLRALPSEAESRTNWQGLKRKALVAWQGIKVEALWEDQVWRLTSQWNGRLRAAHSGAVHRRVRCNQRIEVLSAEIHNGGAKAMREPLLTLHILSVIIWLGCGLYEIFLAHEIKLSRGTVLELNLVKIYIKYSAAEIGRAHV